MGAGIIMLSEIQKNLLKDIAKAKGLKGYVKGKYISLGSKTEDPRKLVKNLGIKEAMKAHTELLPVLVDYDLYLGEIMALMTSQAREMQEERDRNNELPVHPLNVDEGRDFDAAIRSLYPVIDISGRGKDGLFLVNSTTDKVVYDISLDLYLLRTGQSVQDIMKSGKVLTAMPKFDPYNMNSFTKRLHPGLGVEVAYLNTYVPPAWRYVHAEPKFEGFIKILIDHLFPEPQEREDVLDWIHYAVTHRNGTILCLVGPRGTGKSLLMSIVSYLVGVEYSETVNKEILTEKFNAPFKDKRLILLEEIDLSTSESINKLKALSNSRIAMEEKGADSQTIDNFTSMAILMNDLRQFKVLPEERRFSAPKMAEEDLRKIVPEKEIQDFISSMSKDEVPVELAEFGEFILTRKPERSSLTPIRGEYYYYLCTLNMAIWSSFLVKFVIEQGCEGEVLTLTRLTSAFNGAYPEEVEAKVGGIKIPTRIETIENFLNNYKHRGEYKVASIVRYFNSTLGKEQDGILPNPEFLNYVGVQKKTSTTTSSSGFAENKAMQKRMREEAEAAAALASKIETNDDSGMEAL